MICVADSQWWLRPEGLRKYCFNTYGPSRPVVKNESPPLFALCTYRLYVCEIVINRVNTSGKHGGIERSKSAAYLSAAIFLSLRADVDWADELFDRGERRAKISAEMF